ncbi:hypothetical protein OTU49_012593 [Cherax quadricarinatus]|uniref:HTH CENPB-type domain-containing protein n=1 Tax=Cherax quadricarinatus TaxID=27406 RepID=A0AAW0VZ23_CHEQU
MEVKRRPRGRPRKKLTVVRSRLDELDMVLWLWYQQKCEEQRDVPVYGWMICDKAREFYRKLRMTETVSFCSGWLESFRSHHGITARKNFNGEKYSAGEVDGYQSQFAELVTGRQLTADRIYNVDETGLFWHKFPLGNHGHDGEPQNNEDRLTVVCCANAAGTHRCKLMVIGNSVEPKGVKNLPIIYRVHKDSYINQVLFQDWFYNHFVPEVKKNFIKTGHPADSTALLLLDKSNAHPRLQDLRSGNIFAEFLPDSKTGLIQPMEQGVVQDVKARYRKTFIRRLIAHNGSMEEFNKSFTINEAISDITKAWELVTNSSLKKSWRKLWPDISFIDSDDEEFEGFKPKRISKRNSLKQEILDDVKVIEAPEVKKMFESENLEESIDKWLDCDDAAPTTDRLTDDDLISIIENAKKSIESDPDDSDGHEEIPPPTLKESLKSVKDLIRFMESKNNFSPEQVISQYQIQKTLLSIKIKALKKQALIKKKQSLKKRNKKQTLKKPIKKHSKRARRPLSRPARSAASSTTSLSVKDDVHEDSKNHNKGNLIDGKDGVPCSVSARKNSAKFGNFKTPGVSNTRLKSADENDTRVRPEDENDSNVRPVDENDSNVRPVDENVSHVRPVDGNDSHVRPADGTDTHLKPANKIHSRLKRKIDIQKSSTKKLRVRPSPGGDKRGDSGTHVIDASTEENDERRRL